MHTSLLIAAAFVAVSVSPAMQARESGQTMAPAVGNGLTQPFQECATPTREEGDRGARPNHRKPEPVHRREGRSGVQQHAA